MAAGNDRGGGQSPIITGGAGSIEKPTGLLTAISEIQAIGDLERQGAFLPPEQFTLERQFDFYGLGVKSTLKPGIIMGLLTPLAIGILEEKIPVFGSTNPNLFDRIFVVLVSISYMIGYASFMGWACTKWYGEYSNRMVQTLLRGLQTAAVVKAVLIFFLFNFFYMVFFTKPRLTETFAHLSKYISLDTLTPYYLFCIGFQDCFFWSAWYVLATTVLYMFIIYMTYKVSEKRNNKLLNTDTVPH